MNKEDSDVVYVLLGHVYREFEEDWETFLGVFKEFPTLDSLSDIINSVEDEWLRRHFLQVDLGTVLLNSGIPVVFLSDCGDEIGLELKEVELL